MSQDKNPLHPLVPRKCFLACKLFSLAPRKCCLACKNSFDQANTPWYPRYSPCHSETFPWYQFNAAIHTKKFPWTKEMLPSNRKHFLATRMVTLIVIMHPSRPNGSHFLAQPIYLEFTSKQMVSTGYYNWLLLLLHFYY